MFLSSASHMGIELSSQEMLAMQTSFYQAT